MLTRIIGLLFCTGVVATACDGDPPFPEFGTIRCATFGATFAANEGEFGASMDDCMSDEGEIDINIIIVPPCRVECIVRRYRGVDNPPDWKKVTACTVLPPRSSDAQAVAAFIDNLCGWTLASWQTAAIHDCQPGNVECTTTHY